MEGGKKGGRGMEGQWERGDERRELGGGGREGGCGKGGGVREGCTTSQGNVVKPT